VAPQRASSRSLICSFLVFAVQVTNPSRRSCSEQRSWRWQLMRSLTACIYWSPNSETRSCLTFFHHACWLSIASAGFLSLQSLMWHSCSCIRTLPAYRFVHPPGLRRHSVCLFFRDPPSALLQVARSSLPHTPSSAAFVHPVADSMQIQLRERRATEIQCRKKRRRFCQRWCAML
jgi:hypothetical protein